MGKFVSPLSHDCNGPQKYFEATYPDEFQIFCQHLIANLDISQIEILVLNNFP